MKNNCLRVVQISAAYIGAQKQIEDAIHSLLRKNGIPNKVLFWVGNSDDDDYRQCESKVERLIRRFCYKFVSRSHIFSRLQTRKAIHYIEEFSPNVVHLHTIHHGFIDYPLLFSYLREKNIKIIYTVHDMWPFTGGCYYYTELGCKKFMNGCLECKNPKYKHDCRLSKTHDNFNRKKECYKNQNITFVSVSDWVNQELEKSYLGEYKHCIIYNCIAESKARDDTVFPFAENIKSIIGNRKSLVFVAGSWDERKGYSIICELAKLLGEEYVLIIVGNVSQDLMIKAEPNMVFMGYLNNNYELRCLYSECDLHVSASREETFGMTFVEAAFEGTRSIGFKQTAVGETIANVGGKCSSDFSANGLYETIIGTIEQPKLTEKEVDEIKYRYSEEKMASQYLKLYLEE